MSKSDKLLSRLLAANSDLNFGFEDLRTLLFNLDFEERKTGGSHRIFYRTGIAEIINIQPDGAKAKPYQVKQIRNIILKYKLSIDGK